MSPPAPVVHPAVVGPVVHPAVVGPVVDPAAAGPVIHLAAARPGVAVPVRIGVPMPRGWLPEGAALEALDLEGAGAVPIQARVLARWADRSARWVLVDAAPGPRLAAQGGRIGLRRTDAARTGGLVVEAGATRVRVSTGCLDVTFSRDAPALIERIADAAGGALTGAKGVRLSRGLAAGEACARVETLEVEADGPVRCEVVQRGTLGPDGDLEFVARWHLPAGASVLALELRLRNPRPAMHPGGLWDLGDPGSVLIHDVSIDVDPPAPPASLAWRAVPDGERVVRPAGAWALYQDSSGGERWDSPNHVESDGTPGVRLRGWTTIGEPQPVRGERAQPVLEVLGGQARTAAAVGDFWQNFPKALRCRDGRLSVGLFPAERGRPVELQGGEQKRHRVAIGFGESAADGVEAALRPAHAWVEPGWVQASGAIPGFVVALDGEPTWERHVRTIVDGPNGFAERREAIDEYGWRNFGDLWADHESVFDDSGRPFVSHYNNQYDFVLSAGVHALRTGDERWSRLAREAAEHTVDIDVYHTRGDRAVFNGGLFWHTDHYRPAATSTHRTYSAANAGKGAYGGGPSNEHNYASGLLLHHLRTGDADAREAVLGLADWVIAMDDGAATLLGLVDAGPTGLASRTLDPDYHGPGRGAGNSIATLLDAYAVSNARRYLDKAEELVRRCIHPADDIAARRLDEPERRWSYVVFLQVLGARYLSAKLELGEADWHFQYAREALLHYASWMLEHERPYLDAPAKLELPTETWPAHDLRKCHVLHLAARWDHDAARAARFSARAAFFHDRAVEELERFETRHLTRPLVLLAAYGHLHAHFRAAAPVTDAERAGWRHAHEFGEPAPFLAQRDRVRATLAARLATVRRELRRLVRDRIARRAAARRSAAAGTVR